MQDKEDDVIKICPNGTLGDIIEIGGLRIGLPETPKGKIKGQELEADMQVWERVPMPKELSRIRSMDEWSEAPKEFREKFHSYIEEEFRRRRDGFWFYNKGEPTYITGRHYMLLQWTKIDIGYPSYLAFQRDIFFTWLRAKLTLVVSVSFILSVAALGILISVALFLLMKLLKLKTSFLAFSRRLVKTLRKTSS